MTRTSSVDGPIPISDNGYGECVCQDHYVSLRAIWNSSEFAEIDWFNVDADDHGREYFICHSHADPGLEISCGEHGFFWGDVRIDAFIGDNHLDLCSYHINASCPSNSMLGTYPPSLSDGDDCPDLIISGWTDVMGHDCDDGLDVCGCTDTDIPSSTPMATSSDLLLAAATPSSTSTLLCTSDVYECPDGSLVSRDHTKNCQFTPCPNISGIDCVAVLQICN